MRRQKENYEKELNMMKYPQVREQNGYLKEKEMVDAKQDYVV